MCGLRNISEFPPRRPVPSTDRMGRAPPATPPASSAPWPTPCRSPSNPSRSTVAPSSWRTSSAPTAPPASSSGTGTTAPRRRRRRAKARGARVLPQLPAAAFSGGCFRAGDELDIRNCLCGRSSLAQTAVAHGETSPPQSLINQQLARGSGATNQGQPGHSHADAQTALGCDQQG